MRELPVLLVAALSVWGLVSPRTQWPVLWDWHRRYRDLQEPWKRAQTVRRTLIAPLIMSIVLALVSCPNDDRLTLDRMPGHTGAMSTNRL